MTTPAAVIKEARLDRDCLYDRVDSAIARVKRAIQSRTEVDLRKHVGDLNNLYDKFCAAHQKYLMRADLEADEPVNKEIFNTLTNAAADVETDACRALAEMKAANAAAEKQRQLEARRATSDATRDNMRVKFLEEMNDIVKRMTLLVGEWKNAGPSQEEVNGEVAYYEARFNNALAVLEEYLEVETRVAQQSETGHKRMDLEAQYRAQLRALKALTRVQQRQRQSRDRDYDDEDSNGGGSTRSRDYDKFRNAKIEYPTFSGDMREYLTFKSDLKRTFEEGKFTASERSLVLRNQCLKGAVRAKYMNVTDIKTLEKLLDDEYLDVSRIADMILIQIENFRHISNGDLDGFCEFVDTVEKGNFDLASIDDEVTLSHPQTVRCIEARCPDWVRKALHADEKYRDIPPKERFDHLLAFLQRKRWEARRDMSLRQKQAPQQQQHSAPQQAGWGKK